MIPNIICGSSCPHVQNCGANSRPVSTCCYDCTHIALVFNPDFYFITVATQETWRTRRKDTCTYKGWRRRKLTPELCMEFAIESLHSQGACYFFSPKSRFICFCSLLILHRCPGVSVFQSAPCGGSILQSFILCFEISDFLLQKFLRERWLTAERYHMIILLWLTH